jgi:predicted kinase
MFIIMCGYPKSGKSTFADLLHQECSSPIHIVRPSDWYPDDIDDMSSSKKTEYQIASWEHALDKTSQLLASEDASSVIVLDTCGASPGSFKTLIGIAQMHKHKLIAIFMAVPKVLCMKRIDPAIVQRYSNKIRSAVLEYKSICDELIIIKHESLLNWQNQAKKVARNLQISS